jgi:YD repeat-containing protein
MRVWDTVSALAKQLLGEKGSAPRDLSQVDRTITPERGQRKAGRYTAAPERPTDVEELPEYKFVLHAVRAHCPVLFLTGKAGTGKSTLIHWLVGQMDACAVVAPTAVAAINVGGDTIHSFFGLPPEHLDPDREYHPDQRRRLVMENLKLLIVDEVSMVTPNVVDVIDSTLKSVRRNNIPFGGVPVLFVGDLFQLPPIVATPEERVYFSHRYRCRFFFSADVFRDVQVQPVQLTRVFRQCDREFVGALNHIRVGTDYREAVAMLNRQCFRDRSGEPEGVYLVPTNQMARTINSRELDRLLGTVRLYEATVTGTVPANKWRLPAPDRLELKVGAKVMFVRNHKPDWINGDIGTVVGLEDDHIRIRKDASDNVVTVGEETWQKLKYTYDYATRRIEREVVGTYKQFPVTLGWAVTVHKSQGLTLERMVLDLGGGAFAEGQTYVALSRARTVDGLRLIRPITMHDVKVDPMVLHFYRNLDLLD